MPDPITWYTLGRTVADPGRIMGMVDDKFLGHNADPSAHGQSAEAIYAHRAEVILDHLANSVTEVKIKNLAVTRQKIAEAAIGEAQIDDLAVTMAKIKDLLVDTANIADLAVETLQIAGEAVTNAKVLKTARAYKFIVDQAGNGDFTTIPPAIAAAGADGGGTILILAGTYTIEANVDMPSNINLVGSDPTDCIIDFGNAAYSIRVDGALSGGRRDVHFKNLTFQNCYDHLEGALYFNAAPFCSVTNCRFIGNWDVGNSRGLEVRVKSCVGFRFNDNHLKDTSGRVHVTGGCFESIIASNYFESIEDVGIYVNSQLVMILNNAINTSNGTNGIHLDTSEDCIVSGNDLWSVGGSGIYLEASNSCRVVNNEIEGNFVADYCIRIDGGCDTIVVSGNGVGGANNNQIFLDDSDYCVIANNISVGNGSPDILINDAGCVRNVVIGNRCSNNLVDNGTDTEVGHNNVGG